MSGRLGTADLSQGIVANVYTVPAGKIASVNVSVCNRDTNAGRVRLAISDTANVQGNDEFIEYDYSIPASSALERTGLVLDAGKIVTALCAYTTPRLSVVVTGVEEDV